MLHWNQTQMEFIPFRTIMQSLVWVLNCMVFKYWCDTFIRLFHKNLLVKPVANTDSAKFLWSEKQMPQRPHCNVMLFVCRPKILHKHCFQFLLGPFYLPRETEDNAYAKFWNDKQRALWYVTVFLEWSMETTDSSLRRFLSGCKQTNYANSKRRKWLCTC